MKILVLLVLLAFNAVAQEPLAPIERLEDDDFDVREKATQELSSLPVEYCQKLIDISKSNAPLETKVRTLIAAKNIFMSKVVTKMEPWLQMHAEIGLYYQATDENRLKIYNRVTTPEENREYNEAPYQSVMLVEETFVNADADDKLKHGDVIIAINGDTPIKMAKYIVPDTDYKFVIMRPKNPSRDQDVSGVYPDDYTKMEVTVRSMWKAPGTLNNKAISAYEQNAWEDFQAEAAKSK